MSFGVESLFFFFPFFFFGKAIYLKYSSTRDNAVHRYSLRLLYLEYIESTGSADFQTIATEFLVRLLLQRLFFFFFFW